MRVGRFDVHRCDKAAAPELADRMTDEGVKQGLASYQETVGLPSVDGRNEQNRLDPLPRVRW